MPNSRLPRLDPYSRSSLFAAALVVTVPTAMAFSLGAVVDSVLTGALWAAIVGIVATSVIVTSMLVAHVGVLTAVLGISGVWGGCAAAALWFYGTCPDWLGQSCGPRQYGTVMALGMLAPWVVVTFIVPLPLALRWVVSKLASRPRSH